MQNNMVPLNAQPCDGRGAGTVVVSMPEHPPDYAVWSICSFIYGNPCCLGLIALIFSMKSRDRKMVGDMTGAKTYSSKVCLLNGIGLALIIISTIIFIVVSVVLVNA
ncbi:interferon-induced transmembrane protein 3-like [Neoarius graeffei]|uniref:interferon-induced transmembrane protein 3-like n=1 Tax=Neoarius graeffei TaxID=443677 RepID=UPI00298C29A5|nr:interferon-induced transmembrane protein 3-like [Neoarius graeffei]